MKTEEEIRRSSARRKVGRLLARPVAEQQDYLNRWRSRWPDRYVVEDLALRSLNAGGEDPSEALRLAEMAWDAVQAEVVLADLSSEPATERLLYDLLALIQAAKSSAHRLLGDDDEARRHFGCAADHLDSGSGEPLLRARIGMLEVALLLDHHYYEDALEVLEEVESLLRPLAKEEPVELGRMLSRRCALLLREDEAEGAIRAGAEACRLLLGRGQEALLAATLLDLAEACRQRGLRGPAEGLLDWVEKDVGDFPDPAVALRPAWARGIVYHAGDDLAAARRCLEEVGERFLAADLARDALLAALDLAGVEFDAGDADRLRRVAARVEEILTHPRLRGALNDATRALLRRFLTAATAGEVTPALLTSARNAARTLPPG